jgi:hypothetical protein
LGWAFSRKDIFQHSGKNEITKIMFPFLDLVFFYNNPLFYQIILDVTFGMLAGYVIGVWSIILW